jgi:outer membrane immunogenic protein
MKLLTISFALAALTAAPGFAGGPTVIAEDPAPAAALTPAAVHDWSGAYVGLSYGTATGEVQFDPGSFSELEDGSVAGAHAGYLFQRGAFVYGGEVAYGTISDMLYPGFGAGSGVDRVLDLKAKAAYAANRALFYGVVGYSQSTLYVDGGVWEMDGVSVGAGVDFAMTERVTLGLEYLSRDVSALPTGGGINEANTTINTLSLRVGLSF